MPFARDGIGSRLNLRQHRAIERGAMGLERLELRRDLAAGLRVNRAELREPLPNIRGYGAHA
jgi:hypothetical protein